MPSTPTFPPRRRPRDPRRVLHAAMAAAPESVADGVELVRGGLARAMNVVLIDDPAAPGIVVFDAGEPGMAPAILDAGRGRGGISRVVLGHADLDHRGSAPAIARAGGGRILVECHPDAVAQAEGSGGRDYWRPELLPFAVRHAQRAMWHVWDGGPVAITGTVVGGDEVAGFEVVELPGHAPGHIVLWRERDRVALTSDAFYVTDMWGRSQEPALPLPAYNLDTERARVSLRALAALDPLVVVPGHRGPLRGPGLRARLEAAADASIG